MTSTPHDALFKAACVTPGTPGSCWTTLATGARRSPRLPAPHGVAALAQLMRYIALVSEDLHLEAFRAKIREQAPEAEQAAMTIAEQMHREGEASGQRAMLTKQMVLKFKSLTAEHQTRISKATTEQLERYVERVLTAETIDDVFEP